MPGNRTELWRPIELEQAIKNLQPFTDDDLYRELKFHASNSAETHSFWHASKEENRDLDHHAVVIALFAWIDFAKLKRSVFYHRMFFFYWFLERYDLWSARSVFIESRWIRRIHWPLLIVLVGLFALRGQAPWTLRAVTVLAAYVSAIFIQRLGGVKRGMSTIDAIQSLVPRLAGTACVGLLFALNSKELTKALLHYGGSLSIGICLFVSAAYVVLEMSRRVRPLPRWRLVCQRAADVMATAASHALALIMLTSPLIERTLGTKEALRGVELLSLAAVVMFIGLILNVIWAEESVTLPL